MVQFSDQEVIVISKHPVGARLDGVRHSLRSVTLSLGRAEVSSTGNNSDDLKDTLSSLIGLLLIHPVAKKLRARESRGTVAGELASVFRRLDADDCDLQPFLPLTTLIGRRASDLDIWRAVVDLLSSLSRVTPPASIPSIPPSFNATPRTFTSASQHGSEQTRRLVEPPLREELRGCCFKEVGGFVEKYFYNKSWSEIGEKVVTAVGPELRFPRVPVQDEVWRWIHDFQAQYLHGEATQGVYCTTRSKADLTGSEAERQLDVFMKSHETALIGQHDWADVRVVGELQKSADTTPKFLQLAAYVREIFAAQPTRLYVHGFILSGTNMELHVFDRSGVVSTAFDILKESALFVRVLTGYALMSDAELGLDTFTRRQGLSKFVTLRDDRKHVQLEVVARPIAVQPAIVSRATCCYVTVDGRSVVKFAWQSSRKVTEAEHLRAAHGVKGVARLAMSGQIISTEALRAGLTLRKRRHFHTRLHRTGSSVSQAPPASQSDMDDSQGSKRKLSAVERSPRKKARSDSQVSGLSQEHSAARDAVSCTTDTLVELDERGESTNTPFRDRVLTYVVISPAGRPLSRFCNVPELLCALRDAIKAHRSLFEARILHRDISKHNIIITDPTEADGYSGVLIDLDMATRINADGTNESSGAQQMTGTLEFMAIEILRSAARDVQHTYRHDLESFFYVFLSICVNEGWPERQRPRVGPLQGWYTLPCENIAALKRGHMEQGGFEDIILPKFSPMFADVKGLARNLRDALFSIGKLFTGTPRDHRPLYKSMIDAFDEAISSLT